MGCRPKLHLLPNPMSQGTWSTTPNTSLQSSFSPLSNTSKHWLSSVYLLKKEDRQLSIQLYSVPSLLRQSKTGGGRCHNLKNGKEASGTTHQAGTGVIHWATHQAGTGVTHWTSVLKTFSGVVHSRISPSNIDSMTTFPPNGSLQPEYNLAIIISILIIIISI